MVTDHQADHIKSIYGGSTLFIHVDNWLFAYIQLKTRPFVTDIVIRRICWVMY